MEEIAPTELTRERGTPFTIAKERRNLERRETTEVQMGRDARGRAGRQVVVPGFVVAQGRRPVTQGGQRHVLATAYEARRGSPVGQLDQLRQRAGVDRGWCGNALGQRAPGTPRRRQPRPVVRSEDL